MHITATNYSNLNKKDIKKTLYLVTCVFCVWGLSYGLLDVLNKHFQEAMHITKAQSGLLQFSYFLAYFVVAIPAAVFNEKFGYKGGILLGLCLFSIGALLFIPASSTASFYFFLVAIFVLACGLGFLESACNPYVTILGDPETSERRLNMAQSFCGLGTIIGPLIGGMLFFQEDITSTDLSMVKRVYVCLAIAVLIFVLVIARTPMPEVKISSQGHGKSSKPLFSHYNFVGGIIAQFFYMTAQVGAGVFFINYAIDNWHGLTSKYAAFLLSLSMLFFVIGRFISTFVMGYIAPEKLLSYYSFINIALSILVIFSIDTISVFALIATFFFMSIMFPTIFSLGIKGLGDKTKKGSAILLMSVIGGAISPYIMGKIADNYNISHSYIIPLIGFAVIFLYGTYIRGTCKTGQLSAILMRGK